MGWKFAAGSGQKTCPPKMRFASPCPRPLLAVLPQVLARVRELFDLNCDPNRINETLQAMETLKSGLCVPGVRVPGCFDPFEMAVRTILGQQTTVKGATTLALSLIHI